MKVWEIFTAAGVYILVGTPLHCLSGYYIGVKVAVCACNSEEPRIYQIVPIPWIIRGCFYLSWPLSIDYMGTLTVF